MRKLKLETLKCIKTEDWTGSDECRVEVFLGGSLQPPLRRNLNDGNVWGINAEYQYDQSAAVKLWDEDSPDPDDNLGTVTFGASLTDHATASFTGDGAKYTLLYSVL